MKKLFALLLVLAMVATFVACAPAADDTQASTNGTEADTTAAADDTTAAADDTTAAADDTTAAATGDVMTYAEYDAAAINDEVVIETYVQATQSWWDNKITVYSQDQDGAYFLYEMACSEEDAAKLVPGTKIRVTGYKGEWSGEVEVVDATFEIIEGADTYVAEVVDVTDLLGTEDLIKKQNQKVLFKGMTVVSVTYKNDEPGDDIYVTVSKDGQEYSFCVERYLTDPETEVYKAVGELQAGDVIDVEGFLYWYEGVNTHITAVTAAE